MSSDPASGKERHLDRLNALPPAKRAAVKRLLQKLGLDSPQNSALPAVQPLPPKERNRDLPLSFDQQRVWFLHQLDPRGIGFKLQLRMLVDAGVDLLERALNDIVARHEVLRTTYRMGVLEPVQRANPAFAQ